jgi:hypothetical protein
MTSGGPLVLHRSFLLVAVAALVGSAGTLSGGGERTANGSVRQGVILVNGDPFFPVMLLDQCQAQDAARAWKLGINLIVNERCSATPHKQLATLVGKQLAVLGIADRHARGGRLLGWAYPDEPDNNGWTPRKLARAYRYARGSRDGLLSFLTTSGRFFRQPFRDPRLSLATTAAFAQLADVAGFDLYPLNACHHDLSTIYDAQRQFVTLAGQMPTFQWIETGPIRPRYCGGFAMTPAELTAEAWLAIAGGARGVGFFTHTWTPHEKAFDVRTDVQHAITRFARLASDVRAGLVGRTVPSRTDSPAIKVIARRGAASAYVFAVNATHAHIHVQIDVPGLDDGSVTVVGEKRSVTVGHGRFSDTFPPLGVHIYVQQD